MWSILFRAGSLGSVVNPNDTSDWGHSSIKSLRSVLRFWAQELLSHFFFRWPVRHNLYIYFTENFVEKCLLRSSTKRNFTILGLLLSGTSTHIEQPVLQTGQVECELYHRLMWIVQLTWFFLIFVFIKEVFPMGRDWMWLSRPIPRPMLACNFRLKTMGVV